MTTATTSKINGVDTEALQGLIAEVRNDHDKGLAEFGVTTEWTGGLSSRTDVEGWRLGGRDLPHSFTIDIDEPKQLCGADAHANPQEYLMAAANACMLNTFVAVCSMLGVTLQRVQFRSEGTLDLRGFLGIDPTVRAGYDQIRYTIRVKGDGTPAQYRKAHEAMIATSPNYDNLARAIRLEPTLIVE